MPDEEAPRASQSGDDFSEPENVAVRGPLAISPIDYSARDVVLFEETLWSRLASLKNAGNSLETRLALRDTYSELAGHYASLGGNDAAVRFLKNALEKADDPEIRHQLARLQAQTEGHDFISSFTRLLKERPYDLKLTLEFCYFLEVRNLHEAALDILEYELSKKLRLSNPEDPDAAATIDGFYALLQARIDAEQQVRLHDYQQLIESSFPESIVSSLHVADQTPEQTIAGHELEEFEADHGLSDEIKRLGGIFFFFAQHYAIPTSIAFATVLILAMVIFRVSLEIVKNFGNGFVFLLMAYLFFEFLRSLRVGASFRLRSHSKISRNAIFASFAMLVLNWIGPRAFGGSVVFFSPIAIKAMSIVLVSAIFWRTYLSMAAIRKSLRKIDLHVMGSLERRAFRRQLAGIVAGTAGYTLLLQGVGAFYILSTATAVTALFIAVQIFFLTLCWRWGQLEQRAEKQKLRDSLTVIIIIAFLALIALEYTMNVPPWVIVLNLSLDGGLLLGVAMTFALQVAAIGKLPITLAAAIFAFLNFAPALDELGIGTLAADVFGGRATEYSSFSRVVIVLLLVVLIVVIKKSRHISTKVIHKEYHMGSTYNFTGGQFGAVGENATAKEFTQQNNAINIQIDLSALATELADLRGKLVTLAQEPAHFSDIAEVALAEQAAKDGNGNLALEKLKRVGNWVWDTATKIGIGVATAAAKQALGI